MLLPFPEGAWSTLTTFSQPSKIRRKQEEALPLVRFTVAVARAQRACGRHFVIENPDRSSAWRRVPELCALAAEDGCHSVRFHRCQSGVRSRAMTRFLTDIPEIAEAFRDQGRHDHGEHIVACLELSWTRELEGHQVLAADGEADADGGEDGTPHFDASSDEDEEPKGEVPADISKETMKQVLKLHLQTGHQSRRRLVRALAIAGAPEEAIRAAKHLRCEVCHERQRPRTHRVASLPRPRYFGDVVHADLVQVFDVLDQGYWLLNVVDAMSGFQVLHVLSRKSSQAVVDGFETSWLSWGGAPVVLVVDMGPEFTSDEFSCWAEFHGARLYHTPVEGLNGDVGEAGYSASQMVLGRAARRFPSCLGDGGRKLA